MTFNNRVQEILRYQSGRFSIFGPQLLKTALRIAGGVLLIAGVQIWLFYRGVTTQELTARDSLQSLAQESLDNRQLEATVSSLRDHWRISEDGVRKRRISEAQAALVRDFADNPRKAVDEIFRSTNGFTAETASERESLQALREQVWRLQNIYADHYAAIVEAVTEPAWYLQPAAALRPSRSDDIQAARFNHALYQLLVGEHEAANVALKELGESSRTDEFAARVLYTQARLYFDAYKLERQPQYILDSMQYARQSAIKDADYPQAKLFLEFLLGMDRESYEANVPPVESEGSGEGQGERGAMSTDSKDL